jgi:acetyltransferase
MSSTEAGLVGKPPYKERPAPRKTYGLDPMFAPASVAVIGATARPGTVGRSVLENLLQSKPPRKVYAVNAKHSEVLGLQAYASIRDVPGPVDLAIVATPATLRRFTLRNVFLASLEYF